ncbi:NAD(P)-binding protein [Cryphonectria parasitica EP155]|uniref:NAD(P)-binding protein n=1 Tax=Cryphonectria parasitica (strain ATCC 38755 / EP155) TaxID=660469 RepID=A0A9P5CNA6_CRYP1|nr:NAD(P)-binding protein [Cryphonectria parasitica EP155]KAF3764117.1 NAD(P)-binding protein [Cryphonectria parasitica EP155]
MVSAQIPFFPRVTAHLKSAAEHIDYDFQPLHIFALIGILVILYIVERALDFIFFHLATPRNPLQGYRRRGPKPTYALITGGSAGLGLGIAKALVRQGFGVIILAREGAGHSSAETQLREALVLPEEDTKSTEVAAEQYVKTIAMDTVTASPEEMEDKLRTAIVDQELRVSILVNNIEPFPSAPPAPLRELATYSPDDIDNVVAANARFPARLTALMLPVLTHRGAGVDGHGMSFGTHRRSLILNIGSDAMVGQPLSVVYSATKAFSSIFSKGLARELEASPQTSHIDVLSVITGNMDGQTDAGLEQYGRAVVGKADGAIGRGLREMYPHWLHHLENVMLGMVSEKSATKKILDEAMVRRRRYAVETARKQ